MGGRINWVVALKPEADAVIRRFRMQALAGGSRLYPVYESRDGRMRLVRSGPGKLHAAAATAWLAGIGAEKGERGEGWINFGIAGSGRADFGETFLGSRIRDGDSDLSWYPAASWPRKRDLPRREVRTSPEPVADYGTKGVLHEMEAAGFYPIALRLATVELCQVLKVVSDDPGHPIDEITPEGVRVLCDDALEQGASWLEAFASVVDEEAERLGDPAGYREWISRGRFTVSQQNRLRRLLQQWNALHPGAAPPDPPAGEGLPGKDCLAGLESLLNEGRRGRIGS